mgnify:CR=1 FL=1
MGYWNFNYMPIYIIYSYSMKYLGGKNKIGRYIADVMKDRIPSDKVDGYLEPFCGSLGVTQHMTTDYKVFASDTHPDLIELWKKLQKNQFIAPKTMSEKRYIKIKNTKSPSALKAFVGFGCSFGGKYFSGYAQKYTNGKNENYLSAVTNSMKKIQPKITKVTFKCRDYKKWKPKNMLIYCDPPYKYSKFPVKYRTSTKKYEEFDNKEFWETMRKWSKKNHVFISEQDAPSDFVSVWKRRTYRSASQSKKTRFKSLTAKKYRTEHLFIYNGN